MKVEVFKRTSDDWFSSYRCEDCKLVRVKFTQTGPFPPSNGVWRVCAWGSDDFGLELDFSNETEAWACFLQVIGMVDVTISALKEMGFSYA